MHPAKSLFQCAGPPPEASQGDRNLCSCRRPRSGCRTGCRPDRKDPAPKQPQSFRSCRECPSWATAMVESKGNTHARVKCTTDVASKTLLKIKLVHGMSNGYQSKLVAPCLKKLSGSAYTITPISSCFAIICCDNHRLISIKYFLENISERHLQSEEVYHVPLTIVRGHCAKGTQYSNFC